MMHRIALIAVALFVALPVLAADPGGLAPVSVGFKGGLALSQHQGTEERDLEYTVGSSVRNDIAVGLFITLPITPRFALQNEVLYVRKGSRQQIGVEIFEVPATLDVTYDMNYLEIPLLLRYNWVIGRSLDVYTLGGFGFGLKLGDRYLLSGEVSDGEQTIPLSADNDMSEVDLFDMMFCYGVGLEFPMGGRRLLLEYRFDLSLQQLPLPTYAYVPFGEDDEILVENEPVPLRNQSHQIMVGFRF